MTQPATPDTIKTIICDLGKVIVDFDHLQICRQLEHLCSHTPEEMYQKVFDSGLEEQLDIGDISPDVFFTRASAALGISIEVSEFQRIWNSIFTLIDGIEPLLNRVRGYRLLCLSNTNPWHFEYCRETFPILNIFDDFILSYRVGKRKPHPAIFQAALERAGATPGECLYIDDIDEFVSAAKKMGINGVVFNSVSDLEKQLEKHGVV